MKDEPDDKQSATFYARASAASDELRKTILTLSAAAVGVFFVALTGHTDRPLSILAKLVVLAAVACFVAAIAFALLTYEYAGRDFYDKAKDGAATRGNHHVLKLRFHNCMLWSFLGGVVASTAYVVLRTFGQ